MKKAKLILETLWLAFLMFYAGVLGVLGVLFLSAKGRIRRVFLDEP